MAVPHFVCPSCPSIDVRLGVSCSGLLAAVNTGVEVLVWTSVFSSLGRISKSEIAGSRGNSVCCTVGNC